MSQKSTTCVGKKTGEPLTEYKTSAEAQQAARYQNSTNDGLHMVPYNCTECTKWHLSPTNRYTPSEECPYCSKNSYRSYEDAKKRANISCEDQGIKLDIYKCPHGTGWHLTKKS